MAGTLAFVGGGEWSEGCDFDRGLLEASGGPDVLVLPTGAAYEHPERLVAKAEAWFATMGGAAKGLSVLTRPDALDRDHADAIRAARFIYLAGGSPMHLRSVLKDSPVWDAIVSAFNDGAVLAGSSAGAMVLCDPMVDPRGGAFTVGLGLLPNLTVIPHHDTWSEEKEHRTLQLAAAGLAVVGIDERTALIRSPKGEWRAEGAGDVAAWLGGQPAGIDQLPG